VLAGFTLWTRGDGPRGQVWLAGELIILCDRAAITFWVAMVGNERIARSQPLCYTPASMQPAPGKLDMHSEEFLRRLMRRQLQLSISCAFAFLCALLGLPLLNYFFPELMARRVFGFTLSWFILGVLFFPLVWAIAWAFIRRSIALEQEAAAEVTGDGSSPRP
jgi:uncharacterized membrane protein (DUF485 family)